MKFRRYMSTGLLLAAAVVLIGAQIRPWGWVVLAVSALSLALTDRRFAKDMLLIDVSLAILGLTPITTDIGWRHMILMALALGLAVALPYGVSRYLYGDDRVRFPFHHGRRWYRSELGYIGVTAVVSYLLVPFYLSSTAAYLNWPGATDLSNLARLFVGTNALGIWDELFFICTTLGLLRQHFKFYAANLFQAVLFTSFLYELGFRGWGPLMIFGFALIQGYVFKKTESLLYVITIHLTLDCILFLALIHAHHPGLLRIFATQ